MYFKLRFLEKKLLNFKSIFKKFCNLENDIRSKYYENYRYSPGLTVLDHQRIIQEKCLKAFGEKYNILRNEVAQNIPVVQNIASILGVNTRRLSTIPGRIAIPIDIFDSALEDHGYGATDNTTRFDCLEKMIGILDEAKNKACWNSFNPLHWIRLILRLPFLLIKQTGFNLDKIENEFWGRLFKLAFLLLLIYFFLRLGFTHDQITEIFSKKT